MHTQRLQLSNDPNALRLDVHIVGRSQGYAGELEVTRSGGVPGKRAFEDVDCREVASALALSAALSIDPEATVAVPPDTGSETGEDESTGDSPEQTTPSEGEEKQPPDEPSAPPSKHVDSQATVHVDVPEPPESAAPSGEHLGGAASWSLGPQVVANFAFQPRAMLGAGLVVGVRDQSDRHVTPLELALALTYRTSRLTRGNDPLLLDWWAAELRVCPLRGGGGFTLLLCAVGQAGLLQARGVNIQQPQTTARPFFSAGLGLWGRQKLCDHWEITGFADFQVPLVDRAFAVEPDFEVIASSRPVGVGVMLGTLYGF